MSGPPFALQAHLTTVKWGAIDRIVLEKNPHYFKKGLPLLDVAEFRVMKDPQTAMTALRAGQIDLIMRVPVKLVPILERSKNVRVVTGPELAPTVAFLNLRVKPFDDVRAHRAIGGDGLDRNEIAKVAFQSRTQPLVSVLPLGVPDAVNLNEMYPYNPEKAKQLLKELGYDKNNPPNSGRAGVDPARPVRSPPGH